ECATLADSQHRGDNHPPVYPPARFPANTPRRFPGVAIRGGITRCQRSINGPNASTPDTTTRAISLRKLLIEKHLQAGLPRRIAVLGDAVRSCVAWHRVLGWAVG